MRITTYYSPPSSGLIQWGYEHRLTKMFHQALGWNEVHESTSLYSLGRLSRADKATSGGLVYSRPFRWTVSIHEEELAFRFLKGIGQVKSLPFGSYLLKTEFCYKPNFPGGATKFQTQSPVLTRWKVADGPDDHLHCHDERSDEVLTRIFRYKMSVAGLGEEDLQSYMGFDRSYRSPKEELITIEKTSYKAYLCPVIVVGTPRAVAFAYDVGAGHLSGCCFGHLQ